MTSEVSRRVLVITRNLPPLLGGMERLNHKIIEILSSAGRVAVVGPPDCASTLHPDCLVREVPIRPLPRFILSALVAGASIAKRIKPEIVYAGSGLTAPVAVIVARLVGARSIVYLHGLDVIVKSWAYQQGWMRFIRASDLCMANSDNTRQLAVQRGVRDDRIVVLNPGTELMGFDRKDREALRAKHDLRPEQPVLLAVGRLAPRKGLVEFVKHVLPHILMRRPDAVLFIVGADADNALYGVRGSEKALLVEAAKQVGGEGGVKFLSSCSDSELSAIYRAADVHVFPVRDVPGDVEGFGMVAIEAAAHGLPTVAFSVGGVPEAVIEEITGTLVEADDYEGFAAAIERWLPLSGQLEKRKVCAAAAERFGWDRFARELGCALGPGGGKE